MNMKCPYSYPHRSRKSQVQYLADHDSYGGWNHPNRGWSPLAWNVKIGTINWRSPKGEESLDAGLDDQWNQYVESNSELFYWICEDVARQYLEGEYTTYPGDDQGDWKFCLAGRSGGHLLLSDWRGTDFLSSFQNSEHWFDWLTSGITTEALNKLYRAVRCMDQDLERSRINAEFEYQLNFRRHEWEQQHMEMCASY
jgi:hypothetical protein